MMKKIFVAFIAVTPLLATTSQTLSAEETTTTPTVTHNTAATPTPSGMENTRVKTFSLAQLRDSALQNNIAMRKGRLEIQSAKEQRKEVFTNYFPKVQAIGMWFNADKGMAEMTVNPSEFIPSSMSSMLSSLPADVLASLGSPISMSMMKNGVIAGVNATQPVFVGGQVVNGNKLARVGEEASELKLHVSENEVALKVEQYYWQWISMQEKSRTVDASDELLKGLEKDATTAVKAGVALRNDLLQVQLRRNELSSQRLKLHNGMSMVKLLLAQYCGLQDTLFTLKTTPTDELLLAAKQDHEASLSMVPEYQLLEKNVEASRLQQKLEVGKLLPSVAVGAGYNYHDILDTDRSFGMVFATVSVPLSDWWGGSHAIRRKKIAVQEAREQLDDNRQLLLVRMQKAWNDVEEAQQQFLLAGRSIEQAQENLRIQRDTYKAGTSTMNDLLEAQLLYQQACDKQTDAYITYQTALIAYRQATGQVRN